MFCKNCGKELPDGVKFCNGCGAPVAPAPGEEPPIAGGPAPDSGFVPVPGPTMGPSAAPDGGFIPEPGPAQPGNFPGPEGSAKPNPAAGLAAKLKGNKTGLIILGVGAVAVIAVIVLLVNVIGGLIGGGGTKPLYVYLNDDYELMYLPSLSQDAESTEITDEAGYSSGVQFSPDGKTLYFTDADNSLYKIAVADLNKEGKPERIKKDVSSFRVLLDGRLLFREYDSGKLNVYDGQETYTLVKEYDSYQLGGDHKTVYYTERDDDGAYTLYRIAIDKDANKEKLLDGADTIYTSWDSETLVYGEGGVYTYGGATPEGSDMNTLAVYACKPGEKADKLIDDIYGITNITVDGDKVSFYYWVQNVDERTLYDFVTDNNASSDAAILEERPTSPSSWDYSPASYPDGLYIENGVIYCVDNKGDAYPVDTAALQAEQNLPPEELSYWDVLPIARAECTARYEQAREEYNTAYEAWREASNRQSLRDSLQSTDYTQTSYELYRFDGAKPQEPIAADVFSTSTYGAAHAGVFLYKKANTSGGKVGDLSELDGYYDVYTRLESGSNDDDWYQNVGGKESVLDDIDPEASIHGWWVLNGAELVFQVTEDEESSLQSFTIGADALTFNASIVDDTDDFSGVQQGTDSAGKDVLYLFTEVSEDSRSGESSGDFCVYRDGKLETITKEIFGAFILDDSGTTYVGTDIDREGNVELALLKDGQLTTISDEVSGGGWFLDSTQVLYLSDNDLYLWNGKESVRIARDVLRVWVSAEAGYSSYDP